MRKWRATAGVAIAAAVLVAALVAHSGSHASRTKPLAGGVPALGSSSLATGRTPTTVASRRDAGPVVAALTFNGASPAVRDLPPAPASTNAPAAIENEPIGSVRPPVIANDPVLQTQVGKAQMPGPVKNFSGICLRNSGCASNLVSACSCLPPDPNGEVGPTQYVQMVNTSFAVFDKDGNVLKGSTPINQLWSSVPQDLCAVNNDGDPIVLYDQLANRWVLTQFTSTFASPAAAHNAECIAVSQTGDATGAYWLYTFSFQNAPFNDTFFDYPKLGVWPDAYYMTANEFPPNQELSQGVGAFAFERDKMLNGQSARVIFFDEGAFSPPQSTLYAGQLPTDLDGATAPPAGEPNFFMEVDDPQSLPAPPDGMVGFNMRIWKFHVDWTNPANSTFGSGATHLPNAILPVAPMTRFQCVYGHPTPTCIPQKNGAEGLDALDDRLMFRLAYRNFGDHEALVVNQTAAFPDANAPTGYRYGVRWYEVRNPNGSPPTLYQQGTYAPADDPLSGHLLWRWMGSAAMDRAGDLAIGYSASGPNDFPSLRYAGRTSSDPLGTLPLIENTFPNPYSGPQSEAEGRWGDYSDLTVDPSDDCTFWYTQEWLNGPSPPGGIVILGTSWRTTIGAFKFANCAAPTAVDVKAFSARWTRAGVKVAWRTAEETKTLGFNVYRVNIRGVLTRVNATLIRAKRSGGATGALYRLLDRRATRDNTASYKLQLVDLAGKRSWYGVGTTPARS